MKPKYSRLRFIGLPALMIVPAMSIALGAVINTDATGNRTITTADNGANSVLATGGTDTTPTVTVQPNVVLTGDPVAQNGIRFTAPNYTLFNDGSLSGNLQGILVDPLAAAGLIIDNAAGASITGQNDGILLSGNGGTIFNNGLIRGQAGVASDGIQGLNLLYVDNAGTITGNAFGISAINNLTVFNDPGALITGNLGGITAATDATITNNGTISGFTGSGITTGTNGTVFNTGTIEGTTGITATNGSSIQSSGIIRSTAIGGNAFTGGVGNDALFLDLGSSVDGNIVGGLGVNSLTLTDGRTSTTSLSNEISGSVTGFTTITKAGSGLALIGNVADAGTGLSITANTIQINSGALYFNSNIAGATVPRALINANGTAVGGTGTWLADLNVITGGVSAGAIPINLDANPENAVGTFTIVGDVVHSTGSFIRMDIIPDTVISNGINSDLIVQTGVGNTYDVTGANLRISTTDVNRVITPGTYTIVNSAEQIVGFNSLGTVGVQFNANTVDTGQFIAAGSGPNYLDSVFTNFFVTPGLADANTNLVMDVDYMFANLPGLTPTEAALGGALDALALQAGTGTLGLAEQDLIAALALSDLGSVQASLAGLSPESSVALVTSVINSNYRIHRMVQDHLAMVRDNSSTVTMTTPEAPVSDGGKGGMTYQPQQQRQESFTSRGNFWGSVSYDDVDYEDDISNNEFDGETGALTVGFDYRVSPMFVIGGLLDGSRSDFDTRGGGSSEIDSLRAGIYGTFGDSLGFYSDFYAGYGEHDLDEQRLGGGIIGLAGNRGSSPESDSLQAMLTFGYTMGSEQVKHGPFAGLEYQSVDVDDYNQISGPFNVGVDGYSIDSMRGLIGYRVNAAFGAVRPYASVAYAHEFEDDANTTIARFGGAPFQVSGPKLESSVIVTAGTGYAFNENFMMNLGYRGDISLEDSGITSHGATLGFNYSF